MSRLATAAPTETALARLDHAAVPQYLIREQIGQLVAACVSERDRLLVRMGWETGARISELLGIRRFDLDLRNRQIRLRTLKRRAYRQRKRREQFRWVPISDALAADLARYLLEHALPEDQRMFPFSRVRAFQIVRDAGGRAHLVARGGRHVSPHILRHSFAMNCLTQGVPINVVKELLGHASVLNTMIYLKSDPSEARSFLSRVEF